MRHSRGCGAGDKQMNLLVVAALKPLSEILV